VACKNWDAKQIQTLLISVCSRRDIQKFIDPGAHTDTHFRCLDFWASVEAADSHRYAEPQLPSHHAAFRPAGAACNAPYKNCYLLFFARAHQP
jgi:hypothetical protein